MMIFCRFENGRQSGLDAASEEEAAGFVHGLATAALCLGARVWVTQSLPGEAGVDNDNWLTPQAWLDANS